MKNSVMVTWLEKGWQPLFYKLRLSGNLGRMNGWLSCEVCFFRVAYCIIKWIVQLCPTQTAYWAKKFVTMLTRAAHWITYYWGPHT